MLIRIFCLVMVASVTAANAKPKCIWSESPTRAMATFADQLQAHGFQKVTCGQSRDRKTHRPKGWLAIKSPKPLACFVSANNMHADFWVGRQNGRLGMVFRTGGLINNRRDRATMAKLLQKVFAGSNLHGQLKGFIQRVRTYGLPKKRAKTKPRKNPPDPNKLAALLNDPAVIKKAQAQRKYTKDRTNNIRFDRCLTLWADSSPLFKTKKKRPPPLFQVDLRLPLR
ncbi:MAG: hypothetical protein ACR2PA_15765 [Hyphomicrobiaceae bacterium]